MLQNLIMKITIMLLAMLAANITAKPAEPAATDTPAEVEMRAGRITVPRVTGVGRLGAYSARERDLLSECTGARRDIIMLGRSYQAAGSSESQQMLALLTSLLEKVERLEEKVGTPGGSSYFQVVKQWLIDLGFFQLGVPAGLILLYTWTRCDWQTRVKCAPLACLCSPAMTILWVGFVALVWVGGVGDRGAQALVNGWTSRCPSCLGGYTEEETGPQDVGAREGGAEVVMEQPAPGVQVGRGGRHHVQGAVGAGLTGVLFYALLGLATPRALTRMVSNLGPAPTLLGFITGIISMLWPLEGVEEGGEAAVEMEDIVLVCK